jgi:uncharacterized protein YgiM (DUF1202 family)
MAPSTSYQVIDRLALAIAILIVALPLTYLEVMRPSLHQIDSAIQTMIGHHSAVVAAPKPATKATPKPATAAASASTAPVAGKTAITSTYVHLRAAESTTSTILAQLPPGTTLQLGSDSDPTWQAVTYQGKPGYVYRAYLNY